MDTLIDAFISWTTTDRYFCGRFITTPHYHIYWQAKVSIPVGKWTKLSNRRVDCCCTYWTGISFFICPSFHESSVSHLRGEKRRVQINVFRTCKSCVVSNLCVCVCVFVFIIYLFIDLFNCLSLYESLLLPWYISLWLNGLKPPTNWLFICYQMLTTSRLIKIKPL